MLTENKLSKYLLYAVGEIVLVVIGILIALSINNWNELQKESVLEKEYLINIKRDLQQDADQAAIIVKSKIHQLNIIKFLEPGFKLDSVYMIENIDTINFPFLKLFHRENSFRSTRSAYSSLIADGKSNLIENKLLFQKIQSIYDEQYPRIYSLYYDLKRKENSSSSTYSYEKFHWNYQTIQKAGNERIIADLANFWETAHYYCTFLDESILEMKKIIKEIDVEIDK